MISPRKNPCVAGKENSRRLAIAGVVFLLLAVCLVSGQSFGAFRTYYTQGQYCPPGSLGEHLFSEARRLTNRANGSPVLTTTRRGYSSGYAEWNTNFFFFGCSNVTGQSLVVSNNWGDGLIFGKMLISRVAAITAAHTGSTNPGLNNAWTNEALLFVDRTNGQHWRKVIRSLSDPGPDDYAILVLDSPVPASIEPMPIVWPSNVWAKLANRSANPWPVANACQHSRVISPLYGFDWSEYHGVEGGDSGSPTWIVVSNRCVAFPLGYSSPGVSDYAQFVTDYNTALTNAGYTTNTHPLVIESLSQFPDL